MRWLDRIWPFSVLNRIEGKIDVMTKTSEDLKRALDHIGAAFAGIQASIASISANLAACSHAAEPDPLLQAAIDEAQDLDKKMTAFAASLQSDHGITVPVTDSPHPPPSEATTGNGGTGGDDGSGEQSGNAGDGTAGDGTTTGDDANKPS